MLVLPVVRLFGLMVSLRLPPIARPSLKLCIPSPMMTIQAMLAMPASFISWSEWQFPPWECPCPCLRALRPPSVPGAGRSCLAPAGASGVLVVGESGGCSSLSCVSLCVLSQETAELSGSERQRRKRYNQEAETRT